MAIAATSASDVSAAASPSAPAVQLQFGKEVALVQKAARHILKVVNGGGDFFADVSSTDVHSESFVYKSLLDTVRAKAGKPADLFSKSFVAREQVWRSIVFSSDWGEGADADFCRAFVEDFVAIAQSEDTGDETVSLVWAKDFSLATKERAERRKAKSAEQKTWEGAEGGVQVLEEGDGEGEGGEVIKASGVE